MVSSQIRRYLTVKTVPFPTLPTILTSPSAALRYLYVATTAEIASTAVYSAPYRLAKLLANWLHVYIPLPKDSKKLVGSLSAQVQPKVWRAVHQM